MSKEEKKINRLITPIFRVSFPHLLEPQPPMSGTGKPKFGVMAVWTPAEFAKDGDFAKAEKAKWEAIIGLANEASLKKFQKTLNQLPPNFKKPFHRGDEKAEYGFTAAQIYTNITSHIKPGCVLNDGKTKIADKDLVAKIYAGCYCRASVNAYGYDNQGKGVAFGLNNIMFVKDGERLYNVVDAAVEFAEYGEVVDPFATTTPEDDLGLGL